MSVRHVISRHERYRGSAGLLPGLLLLPAPVPLSGMLGPLASSSGVGMSLNSLHPTQVPEYYIAST